MDRQLSGRRGAKRKMIISSKTQREQLTRNKITAPAAARITYTVYNIVTM